MNILTDAFKSLGANINKRSGRMTDETEEGVVSDLIPELALDMKDEDLLSILTKTESAWDDSDVKGKWMVKAEENEKYWLGNHFNRPDGGSDRAMVDNAIFEGIETYLPQMTRRNPEPMVQLKQGQTESPEYLEYTKDLQKELGELADELKIRLKLKKAGRHWMIYLLGVAKYGWDMNKDIPAVRIVRPQKMILDPDATIDEDGYTGELVGEIRKMTAGKMLGIVDADKKKIIQDLIDKKNTGSMIQFQEWWSNEYMCWRLGNDILLKRKNPHWNYDQKTTQPGAVDDMGVEAPAQEQTVPGTNHFSVPRMPYSFLSIFNLGKQPVDDTSLIGQNLANQDIINKRNKQIDKNADNVNGGMVVSLERSGLNKDQAEGVSKALRKGGVVAIPTGSPREAIDRFEQAPLSAEVYNQLVDMRNRVRDIFGTRGSTPAGTTSETTVRGKILNKNSDTDRVGGGVSEYLEQFADDMYGWMVQLLYVYDDRFRQAIQKGVPKVKISVKEGSLLPKDTTTIANQAIELAGAGKMATIDLYKRLDYPNPQELAANVWLEANAPEMLFKDNPAVQQVIQQRQQAAQSAAQKPPSLSISYKDLPPEGQVQAAQQAGIQLHPEAIAAYKMATEGKGSDPLSQVKVNSPPT